MAELSKARLIEKIRELNDDAPVVILRCFGVKQLKEYLHDLETWKIEDERQ